MFTHGPVRGVCMMSVLAGLLAFPLPVRLPDSSVAFVNRRSKEGITAAGTAPVFSPDSLTSKCSITKFSGKDKKKLGIRN